MIKWNDLVNSINHQADWQRLIHAIQVSFGLPRNPVIRLMTHVSPRYQSGKSPSMPDRQRLLKALHWLDQGHPIDYIMGEILFYKRVFWIKRGVLLPRVETEWLVEMASQFITQHPIQTVLELGSGAGVIGLSLALEHPDVQVWAWDISRRAVALTNRNHQRHPCSNFHCRLGSFFNPITGYSQVCHSHALIISNPPYIPTPVLPTLSDSVRMLDPKQALDGKQDGLFFYKKLMAIAKQAHIPLLCEIGFNQAGPIRTLAIQYGLDMQATPDLAGHDRLALFIPKNSNLK